MKITSNIDAVIKSFSGLLKEYEQRAKHMVSQFTWHVTLSASKHTKLGDHITFERWYKARQQRFGMTPIAGYHKQAWSYSESGSIGFNPVFQAQDSEDTANDVQYEFDQNYSLGSTYYIGAKGPAYAMLEAGGTIRSPSTPIMQPTIQDITSVYQLDLGMYFNSSIDGIVY